MHAKTNQNPAKPPNDCISNSKFVLHHRPVKLCRARPTFIDLTLGCLDKPSSNPCLPRLTTIDEIKLVVPLGCCCRHRTASSHHRLSAINSIPVFWLLARIGPHSASIVPTNKLKLCITIVYCMVSPCAIVLVLVRHSWSYVESPLMPHWRLHYRALFVFINN